jgi:hypothetical protein
LLRLTTERGEVREITGAVMFGRYVQVRSAGVGSTWFVESTARTSNTCGPWVSCGSWRGLVHAEYGAWSKLHWKVAPATFEENVNVGIAVVLSP